MKTGLFFILLSLFTLILASSEQPESNQSFEIKSSQLIEIDNDCIIPVFNNTLKTNFSIIILFKIFHQTNPVDAIYNQLTITQYSQNKFAFLETKFHRLKQIKKFKQLYPVDKNDDHFLS